MEDVRIEKICEHCKKPFKTLMDIYTTCVYCWVDKLYGRSLAGKAK